MNREKYCKFCDKTKPEEEFCRSGGYIKNICKECQNKKQKKIYSDAKKLTVLEQRINKGIEYIKEHPCTIWYYAKDGKRQLVLCQNELLDILKGCDKE